jgi:hypothetical protein
VAWFLAFVHVGTRKVYLSPPTLHPHERWVEQQTRNAMMWLDDNELKAEFVVHDRDTKFSFVFDRKFYNASIKIPCPCRGLGRRRPRAIENAGVPPCPLTLPSQCRPASNSC